MEASRITGLDAKTLRNIAYVAARFDLSRRRDKLTWTLHFAECLRSTPPTREVLAGSKHSRSACRQPMSA